MGGFLTVECRKRSFFSKMGFGGFRRCGCWWGLKADESGRNGVVMVFLHFPILSSFHFNHQLYPIPPASSLISSHPTPIPPPSHFYPTSSSPSSHPSQPLFHVMVDGSTSSLANFLTSSAVNLYGSVLSIPSFWMNGWMGWLMDR